MIFALTFAKFNYNRKFRMFTSSQHSFSEFHVAQADLDTVVMFNNPPPRFVFLRQGLSIPDWPGAQTDLPNSFFLPRVGIKGVCQHTWISHVLTVTI